MLQDRSRFHLQRGPVGPGRAQFRGFTLIELMIALLILSALGMGMTTYLRRSQKSLRSSDVSEEIRAAGGIVQKLLTDDIKQAVFLNASCLDNQASASATVACSSLQMRGSITPLPGVTKSDVAALTDMALPANLTSDPSTLTETNDAIRIVQYDFSANFNCRLSGTHVGDNPSITAGTAAGAERMWAYKTACEDKLAQGGLYVLLEQFGTSSFANLFQIMALTDLSGSGLDEYEIDTLSTGSIYNQTGGMGLSGYTNEARIYPVKIVEWALEPGAGLYRREISPTSTDLNGYGSWMLIQANVESIRFFPVTITSTDVIEHQRTLNQLTSDLNNNGVEDIRGVSPWFVIKSTKATQEDTTYDSPMTSADENDAFPRLEFKFFIDLRNART